MGALRWLARIALCAFPVLVSGCSDDGPKTYPVKGTVSYQGKPLPLGTVMFVPLDGPPATSTINSGGSYSLQAVAGTHKVEIIAMPPVVGGKADPAKEGGYDYTGATIPKSLIPEKFNRYETSGIEVQVQAIDENRIDLTLQ